MVLLNILKIFWKYIICDIFVLNKQDLTKEVQAVKETVSQLYEGEWKFKEKKEKKTLLFQDPVNIEQ